MVATHDDRLLPLADQVVELTPRAVRRARCRSESVSLADGEVLFEQGDAGVTGSTSSNPGRIEIFRVLDDGTDERSRSSNAGNYFGELAPMFGLRRAATPAATSSHPSCPPNPPLSADSAARRTATMTRIASTVAQKSPK